MDVVKALKINRSRDLVRLAMKRAGKKAYGHVKFLIPEDELSATVSVSGKIIGLAHGHQFRSGVSVKSGRFAFDKGIPHKLSFAKYAAAFFKISRSSVRRLFSLRNRFSSS